MRLTRSCSPRARASRRVSALLSIGLLAVAATTLLPIQPASAASVSVSRAGPVENIHIFDDRAGIIGEQKVTKRHGDHEDSEDNENEVGSAQSSAQGAADMLMEHMDATDKEQHPHPTALHDEHTHEDGEGAEHAHSEEQEQEHHHHNMDQAHAHGHSHEPNPYDLLPLPQDAGDQFVPVPVLKHVTGHSHGSGGTPAELDLNETNIIRGKGPDPLSYIEWDFAYGIGKKQELLRFADAYRNNRSDDLMSVSGGRWRNLIDEKDGDRRSTVAQDIVERVQASRGEVSGHAGLLLLHVIGCVFSCFILLPIALALRAADSQLAPLLSLSYLVCLGGSLFLSVLYKALTPRLYPSNSHGGLGWVIFVVSLVVLGGDILKLLRQLIDTFIGLRGASRSSALSSLWSTLKGHKTNIALYDAQEEERMLAQADEDGEHHQRNPRTENRDQPSRTNSQSSTLRSGSHSPPRVHFEEEGDDEQNHETEWPRRSHNAARSNSGSGDLPSPTSTLCNTPRTSIFGELHPKASSGAWKVSPPSSIQGRHERVDSWRQFDEAEAVSEAESQSHVMTKRPASLLRSIIRYTHVTVARSMPVLSFAAAYTGISVYTGSCRGPYGNVCLAHGIKGGIFFWYGLLSFARYLGAYADIGWAWNKRPETTKRDGKGKSSPLSAEFVECLVIFIYGATNTWMERFGAEKGDPYTVKQVQHISIAVMFWFAGLMGMLLESRKIRDLISLPVLLSHSSSQRRSRSRGSSNDELAEAQTTLPPSYSFSFNPFPALVIGVTGLAMAAHHQDYVYEVEIHMLWGNLLAGFSALRILSYFLLWLRPPTSSALPSRPPTEALASFSLAAGGFVFMLSSEEVSYAAMRNGFGDFMMILNVTVAVVCLVFCGIAALMIIKAAAVKREHRIRHHTQTRRHDEEEYLMHQRRHSRGYSNGNVTDMIQVNESLSQHQQRHQPREALVQSPVPA